MVKSDSKPIKIQSKPTFTIDALLSMDNDNQHYHTIGNNDKFNIGLESQFIHDKTMPNEKSKYNNEGFKCELLKSGKFINMH